MPLPEPDIDTIVDVLTGLNPTPAALRGALQAIAPEAGDAGPVFDRALRALGI